MTDVVLPRRAHAQPAARLNPGGDCASCAIGGAVGLPVAEIHDLIESTKGRSRTIWPTVLRELQDRGVVEDFVDDTPLWPLKQFGHFSHGLKAVTMGPEWWRYLRMALRAGYYGLASVTFSGKPYAPTDHLVLLCGARERWDPPPPTLPRAQVLEVLVSCSASCPQGRWEDKSSLLERGAFDVVLVRPRLPC